MLVAGGLIYVGLVFSFLREFTLLLIVNVFAEFDR